MNRRAFQRIFCFTGLLAFACGAEVATAAPYYATTYVGKDGDVWDGRTSFKNQATGEVYPFDPGVKFLSDKDSSALNLPKTTVWVGAAYPAQFTYSMLGTQLNESTGTIVGKIPNGGSRANPWGMVDYGYVKPDANGDYSRFHALTNMEEEVERIRLNSADQALIRIYGNYNTGYEHPPGSFLVDLNTGAKTNLNDLVDPKFMTPFVRLNGVSLDAHGNILAEAIGFDKYGMSGKSEGFYILTPPGVEAPAPVPEPSLLWLAAGALGLGLRARRRKTRGA